jgi:lipoyl(octanoyl) transferase
LWLDSGPGDAAVNMATDEALLEFAGAPGRPVFRSYGWAQAAATFGYFQRHADIAAWTPLRPLLRRPTGGGLVPHAADWTYAVAVPPGHAWYALSARESYRRMHAWLRDAGARLGHATELAACCEAAGPGQCFVGWEEFDLLHAGRKIAGAAQRRNRLGLLIQGSLQPIPAGWSRAAWHDALRATAREQDGVTWEPFVAAPEFTARVTELAREKYGRAEYHGRR